MPLDAISLRPNSTHPDSTISIQQWSLHRPDSSSCIKPEYRGSNAHQKYLEPLAPSVTAIIHKILSNRKWDCKDAIAGTPSSSTIAPSTPSSAVAPAAPSSTIAPAAQSAAIAPAAPSCAIAPATPSCAIAPVAPPATIPAESTKTSDKFRLSSEEMAKYAKLPTQKFCTLQAIHIRYSAKLQLSEQNQLAAEGYRQAQSSAAGVALPGTQSNNLAEVFTRRKTLPSQKKMMEGVEAWKLTVQRQLKEMSNSMQIEGFLVLALQDCTHNFFLQGGSFLGQQYL
ncbi:hypothetical protein PCANC_02433 [Puccinia coronata f. sp. avenae]|uniref:Uncharacterized protein n=1 Tax=Puccinia coronata f. sp. avenae TaxID=200324 RepID=A0A2N5W4Y7_9BASI|nr:hypothetical protein PCANC_02433 [Puccinia coronata f. sp. avenae]